MSIISLDEFGKGVDMVRAAGAGADGPEYGFCRGDWQVRRIWDWSRHAWRTVRAAEVGCKPSTPKPLPELPSGNMAGTHEDKIIVICEWLEQVGAKSRQEIAERFDVNLQFCATWAYRHGNVMTRQSSGTQAQGEPRTLYSAVPGWREAYTKLRASANRGKLKDETARILNVIEAHPGATRRMIAEKMGMHHRQVRTREKTLLRYELVRKEGEGIDCRYWPVEGGE